MKEQEKEQQQQQPQKPSTLGQKVKAFFKEFFIVLGAFLVLNNFVLASFMVPTGSMENEVMAGDLLFVNKFIYGGTSPRNIPFTNVRLPWFRVPGFRDVERGDVIVFVFPGFRDEVAPEEFTFYLKRCVGLPGDTLRIENRVLYANGEQFPLPRNLKFNRREILPQGAAVEGIFPKGASWNEDNYGPLVVPKRGMTIPLGSENFAAWEVFIEREGHSPRLIDGRVEIDGTPVEQYVVERDYLFGMGDNRDNSLDGRYWGFIPRENLVGTPLIVYWSWSPDIPIYSIFDKLASVRLGRVGTLIR
ncbi:MAG TPA: signal peptidase I [Bacteroidota bacterium]